MITNRAWGVLVGLGCLSHVAIVSAADVIGVLDWARRVELGTLVSGVVTEVHVAPGDRVSVGDHLLGLDGRGFRAELGRRQAAHKHARLELAEAEREDQRATELYERTVLSDFERNQALVALQAARANAEAARADLVQARLDLERSVLKAPFDGLVLSVDAAPGQTVNSELHSTPLITLADNRVYHVRAQVDGGQAAALEPGERLDISVAGHAATATVRLVGYEPVAQSPRGPLYELLATVEADPARPLRVGQNVSLALE